MPTIMMRKTRQVSHFDAQNTAGQSQRSGALAVVTSADQVISELSGGTFPQSSSSTQNASQWKTTMDRNRLMQTNQVCLRPQVLLKVK